jgi:hypothetical protein
MKILSVVFFLSTLFACSEHRHFGEKQFKNLTTDSSFNKLLSDKANALNIPQINNGVDSFELRIWHGISIVIPNQLMILKYQDSSWHVTDTDYWLPYKWQNGTPKGISFDSSFTRAVSVPPSISDIVDTLTLFRLDTFPSQSEIPGFEDRFADGNFYHIEIATPHYYKALYYANPHRYDDKYNQRIEWLLATLNTFGLPIFP